MKRSGNDTVDGAIARLVHIDRLLDLDGLGDGVGGGIHVKQGRRMVKSVEEGT